jgi:hypothetical protein
MTFILICIFALLLFWFFRWEERPRKAQEAQWRAEQRAKDAFVYENPFECIARQTLLNGGYGEAMTKARQVSIENHDRWCVVKDTGGFSAVCIGDWVDSGRTLIAVFDDGWQLPQHSKGERGGAFTDFLIFCIFIAIFGKTILTLIVIAYFSIFPVQMTDAHQISPVAFVGWVVLIPLCIVCVASFVVAVIERTK